MTAVVPAAEASLMALETAEELALARRVVQGEESALQALYQRYADPLFGFVYHYLDGARPEAEEVWQDTLLAALQALGNYRGESRLFAWLCSIARHKLADHWRRQGRTRQHLSLVPPEDLVRMLDEGPLPDEIVSQRATCQRVTEVLGQLPPDYQKALVARFGEGRSVTEVAQLLDRSYKATESVLSRAKAAFRSALANWTEEEL